MSIQLWYSPASPFVRKVMVFAHEAGLADSLELVTGDIWAPDATILKDNPLGKVPALVTPDGVFPGSYLCCEYLDSKHSGTRLIPTDPRERWPVMQLHAFADGIIEAGVASVVEQVRRPKACDLRGLRFLDLHDHLRLTKDCIGVRQDLRSLSLIVSVAD